MEEDSVLFVMSVVKNLSPVQTNIDIQKADKYTDNLTVKHRNLPGNELDPKCVVLIGKRLVRIEYPGEVINVDKAIETLGGIDKLESTIAQHGRKLELYFHPTNKYNKPCFADKDFKPGILIKVKKKQNEGVSSFSDCIIADVNYDYEIEGVSVINFSFNKLCDFQYLPLVAFQLENKLSKTINIYEKMLPTHLPKPDWLENENAKNMDQFLLPVCFSHHDSAQTKLIVDNNEKTEPKLKLKGGSTALKFNPKQQKSVCRIFRKTKQQTSIFVNFKDKDIPSHPLESAEKLLKHRNLENRIQSVKQLFEERPIWTKAAIRHITGLTDEHSKIILPVVAYYFINGPWRITWVKFGYDPRTDPKSRIYQTLDYRIRTAEGTKLKVSAKRSYAGKTSVFLDLNRMKKVSLTHDMSARPKMELDERYYVLRPGTIPPARQMFYQFCDLLLPEIQEKISRLPESCESRCCPKSGFLPDGFLDHSRKIVNEYVLEAVQKELLEDKKILQDKVFKEKEESKDSGRPHLDYYNQMLRKIKKGLYQNVQVQPSQASEEPSLEEDTEPISLSSDEENDAFGELIQSSIPEKIDHGEDEEQSDLSAESSDEAEIDMEAVQEINEMLSQMNEKV